MQEPETIGEYYKKVREFGKEAIKRMPNSFTADEFRRTFFWVEEENNYLCQTPYRVERGKQVGVHSFTSWKDRSYAFLRVRCYNKHYLCLEEEHLGNRVYFRKLI